MRIVRLVFVLFFLCPLVKAVDPTGSIAGTVVDPNGAVVPSARITATAQATGLTRATVSASDGGYVFPLLPVGTYNLSVEATGFRRFEQRGIEVRANVSASVPITLQIGAASDTVTVVANAEQVDVLTGTLRQVVDQRKIIELPLEGRNPATLVLLAPGTADLGASNARGRGDAFQGATYPGAQAITTNGARSDGVNYFLDGGSNIDHYTNVNNPFPNPDALEQFSVQTNNYSAEHGRASGAVVNIVTKSGTNEFHGGLFEFLRNGALNARNFFAPVHDNLKRNQFGGNFGGPIVKDRLFFFGTYQGTQLRNISTGNTAFVLTAAQRNGDFSSVSRQLVDPVTRQPFPGNKLPADRIDPISGEKDLVRAAAGRTFFNQSVSVNHTYTFSSTLLNNFIFSYNRNNGSRVSAAPFSLSSIGVNIANPPQPEIAISVSGFFSVGTGTFGEFSRQNFHFSDTAHWVRGKHDLSFGGDFLRMKVDLNNTFRQSGNFRFRGSSLSGHPLADFLLGRVERFIQGGGEYAARRGNLGSLFVQDNLRASRQLNLN